MRELLRTHRKKVAYLIVGGWNTAFGYGSFAVLYLVCKRLGLHYLVALTVSQALSILNAYVGYKHFVFRSDAHWVRELARFSLVYWIIFAANLVALPMLVKGLGWSPLLGQALFTAVTVCVSYLAHDNFSFQTAKA